MSHQGLFAWTLPALYHLLLTAYGKCGARLVIPLMPNSPCLQNTVVFLLGTSDESNLSSRNLSNHPTSAQEFPFNDVGFFNNYNSFLRINKNVCQCCNFLYQRNSPHYFKISLYPSSLDTDDCGYTFDQNIS